MTHGLICGETIFEPNQIRTTQHALLPDSYRVAVIKSDPLKSRAEIQTPRQNEPNKLADAFVYGATTGNNDARIKRFALHCILV